MNRVVITGIGLGCSLGSSRQACWDRLLEGASGISRISLWDASACNVTVGAEAKCVPRGTGAEWFPANYTRRGVRLFQHAVSEAFTDASLDLEPIPPRRIGVAAGASVNYIDHRLLPGYFRARGPTGQSICATRLSAPAAGKGSQVLFRRQGETMLSLPARVFGLGGPSLLTDTACAASSHSVGEAFRLVQHGVADAMIAGGSGALLAPFNILAFDLIGALSRNPDPATASRHFDLMRDGFEMWEGSGAVVLESMASSQRRGARVYAELAGFGNNLNSYKLTDPSPDGSHEARAISLALSDAGMQPEDIDFVAAHGTSTPKNDAAETKAIRRSFGAHASRLMVSSNKGQIGHTISAAGIINVVCAALSIATQKVPPTANLQTPDPACDLDYV
ncbi:MAG: beta-ketoacyl-[acyl-carrier-protein] synthase family protein, partial [Acidobacteriota bacterium]